MQDTTRQHVISFRGEVWTDARGHATVSIPPDADPPQAALEYALQAIEADATVRVSAALCDGRFSIETDEPQVKVAWRIDPQKEQPR